MKRTGLILLCILWSLSLLAQKDSSQWAVEVLVGPSFSTFYSSNAPVKLFAQAGDGPSFPLSASYKVEKDMAYYPYQRNALARIRTGVSFGVLVSRSLTVRYALVSGLTYEQKGIDHSESFTLRQGTADTFNFERREMRSTIRNNYLTLPLLLRRTFTNGLTLDGGVYVGFLVASHLDQEIEKEGHEQRGQYFNKWGSMMYFRVRPNTARIDAGLMVAVGYRRSISERMSVLARVGGSIGVLKLDREHNNEFTLKLIFNGYILENGNYHGYSSQSRNLQLQAAVGVARAL